MNKEKIYKCKYCNRVFNYANILATHTRWCELNPKIIKYKTQKAFCELCGKEIIKYNYRNKRCNNCKNKMSKKGRINVSNGRKKWLKNNPDKHPWKKNTKFISIPCENFKKYLDSINLKYISEYNVYNETKRNYSIDIAFPDIKLGIEINGNQHYDRNGKLKEYYKNRHIILENLGWKILEIHYTSCFNIESMKNIIQYYKQPDYKKYFINKDKIKNKKLLLKQENKKKKINRLKIKNDLINRRINIILNSNIDFKKFGWVGKISKLLNISSTHVNRFMKKNMIDFYNKNCFKRKSFIE